VLLWRGGGVVAVRAAGVAGQFESRAIEIADLPDAEKPAERLYRLGAAALSNSELLALICAGRSGKGGSLDRVTRAAAAAGSLLAIAAACEGTGSGLLALGLVAGEARAVQAAVELGRRMPSESVAGRDLLNDPRLVKEYLRATVGPDAETQERTGCLYLNARNRLLRNDPALYVGTLDRAVVEPREILRRALLNKAAAVILYHNHPSGDPTPSREDREFTRRLSTASEAVGVRLLDHIVVGREGCVSFREAGLL